MILAPPPEPAAAFAAFRTVCLDTGGRLAAVAERAQRPGWTPVDPTALSLARGGALEFAGLRDPVARKGEAAGRSVELLAGGSTDIAPGVTTLTCAMKFSPSDPAAKAAVRAWLGPRAAELPMGGRTTFAALKAASGDGFEPPPENRPTPEQLLRSVLVLVHESPEATVLTLMGYAK